MGRKGRRKLSKRRRYVWGWGGREEVKKKGEYLSVLNNLKPSSAVPREMFVMCDVAESVGQVECLKSHPSPS